MLRAKRFSTKGNKQKEYVNSKMEETPLSENFYPKKDLLKKKN